MRSRVCLTGAVFFALCTLPFSYSTLIASIV
jgi:hypothetical protein